MLSIRISASAKTAYAIRLTAHGSYYTLSKNQRVKASGKKRAASYFLSAPFPFPRLEMLRGKFSTLLIKAQRILFTVKAAICAVKIAICAMKAVIGTAGAFFGKTPRMRDSQYYFWRF